MGVFTINYSVIFVFCVFFVNSIHLRAYTYQGNKMRVQYIYIVSFRYTSIEGLTSNLLAYKINVNVKAKALFVNNKHKQYIDVV